MVVSGLKHKYNYLIVMYCFYNIIFIFLFINSLKKNDVKMGLSATSLDFYVLFIDDI